MDSYNTLEIIAVLLALGWGAYERFWRARRLRSEVRSLNGQYTQSLVGAAHQLVNEYQEQVQELRHDVRELRIKVTRLEGLITRFGCSKVDCLLRVSVDFSENS